MGPSIFKTLLPTKKRRSGEPTAEQPTELSAPSSPLMGHPQSNIQHQEVPRTSERRKSRETGRKVLQKDRPSGYDSDNRTIPTVPPNPISPSWKTTSWNSANISIGSVGESPGSFPPLAAVAEGLYKLVSNYEQTASNQESIRSVVLRIQNINNSIIKQPIPRDLGEIKRRKRLETNLNDIAIRLERMLWGNVVKRFVNNAEDAQTITDIAEDIRNALTDYQISLQQDVYSMSLQLMESNYSNVLDKLPRARYVGHRSGNRQPCMKGTRVNLLQQIEEWATSKPELPIYWLNGVAGTGKTTISQTLANRFFADERLGASFFLSRDYVDRRNIDLVFPTLAFQLSYQLPEFRAPLVDIINQLPDLGELSMADQLRYFLIKPFKSLIGTPVSTRSPIIIIIDALDECDDPELESKFLSLLSKHIMEIPFVKFFITSSPEYTSSSVFGHSLKDYTETFVLQDVDPATVDRDIRKYLQARLSAVANKVDITTPWPSLNDIEVIVRQCAGLFIYAATIVKFIESPDNDPPISLQLIMSMPDRSISEVASETNVFYTRLLMLGFSKVDPSDYQFFERVRLVLACILFVLNPLPLSNVAELLDMRQGDVTRILRSLHSVLLIPDDVSQPARRFHKSFPDFLTDPKRRDNSNFYLDPAVYHGKIAIHCLNLMKKRLRKNICSIPRYMMNSDIKNLPARRKDCVGSAVEYACLFWTDHISFASATGEDVNLIVKSLKEFFEDQVLPWIEVLSIIENLGVAVYSIRRVQKWLVDAGISDNELKDLIYDCQRFVLQFFYVIRMSVPHIYHSALPILPTSSKLRKRHQDEISKEVNILTGIDISWDACIRRIRTSGRPSCVTFSPNGNLIAICSGDAVEMFDAITGVRQGTLQGHLGDVESIMFSPNNDLLVSGSQDRTIKIWDVETGGLIRTLEGHKTPVLSVSVSPDGRRIASGANDHTIRVWDIPSGECNGILEGHSGAVDSVCWSGDAAITSGSGDGTVKLWDVSTGMYSELNIPKHLCPWPIKFSTDGTKIASGASYNVIRIYDVQTGITKTIDTGELVYSVCFSPTGDQILYGSSAHLYIRDLSLDVPPSTLVGHVSSARYLCFSADGTRIASTDDNIVKIWENWSGQVFYCHSQIVSCVCFSADGQFATSASADETIRVWDAATGACLHTIRGSYKDIKVVAVSPDGSFVAWDNRCDVIIWNVHADQLFHRMQGHSGSVEQIQFSPDGLQMISASKESMVIWSTETGAMLAVEWPKFSSLEWIRFAVDGTIVLRADAVVKRWKLDPNSVPSSIGGLAGGPDLVTDVSEVSNSTVRTSLPAPSPSFASATRLVSVPLVFVQIPEGDSASPFSYLEQYRMEDGWILGQEDRRVCRIPEDHSFACHNQKVIIGTTTGNVLIIDLSGANSSIE